MTARWVAQGMIVVVACVAGFLVGHRPGAPAHGARGDAARSTADVAAAPRRGTPPGAPRTRPGWRRPATADERAFLPVVVNPADVPRDPSRDPLIEDVERDPVWAEQMEQAMGEAVRAVMAEAFPEVVVDLACRTVTCTVELETEPELVGPLNEFVVFATPLGPRVRHGLGVPRDEGKTRLRYDIELRELSTPDAWRERFDAVRAQFRPRIDAMITARKEGLPWPEL